jgi:ketosteroid isomerase-like protein
VDRFQIETLARAFLSAYESKDLGKISSQLADGVVVRDWNLEVVGKANALREFAKNFEQARSLSIQVIQLHSSNNGVAAEVEIVVNGEDVLRVVDILTFGINGEVTSIVSYKGL